MYVFILKYERRDEREGKNGPTTAHRILHKTVLCTFSLLCGGERERKMVLLVVLIRKVVRVREERRDTGERYLLSRSCTVCHCTGRDSAGEAESKTELDLS